MIPPHRSLAAYAVLALTATAALLTVSAGPSQAAPNPYRLENPGVSDPSSPKTTAVSCNGNDRLMGMGAKVDGGGGEVLLTRLEPDAATDTVTAFAVEHASVTTNWSLIAWVICAPAGTEPANLQIVDDTLGPDANSPKVVGVACPANTVSYSIGYRVSAGNAEVAVDEVEFEPNLVTGTVTAYDPDALAGNWSLKTYVVCGAPAPNMELKEWTSADNSITPKTETTDACEGLQHVHGVGAVVEGARGDAAIAMLNPRPQLTVGEATVREIGTTADAWDVKVQSVCSD